MQPQNQTTLNLSEVTSPYINLSTWPDGQILVLGRHEGPRIVLSGVSRKTLKCCDAEIVSQHDEDALAVDGLAESFSIIGGLKLNNALSFWGVMRGVTLSGISSVGAHTGIRSTVPRLEHRDVQIRDCTIRDCSHEGIYIGPSNEYSEKADTVLIENCMITNAGWDGIQGGNIEGLTIRANELVNCGRLGVAGQDYAITVNPGCRAVIVTGNKISSTHKLVQMLDSEGTIRHNLAQHPDGVAAQLLNGGNFIIQGEEVTIEMQNTSRGFLHEWPY